MTSPSKIWPFPTSGRAGGQRYDALLDAAGLVVPASCDYLLEVCGVKPSDLTIVIANGTHIGGNEQELRTLVTDGVYDRIRVETMIARRRILSILGTTPQ